MTNEENALDTWIDALINDLCEAAIEGPDQVHHLLSQIPAALLDCIGRQHGDPRNRETAAALVASIFSRIHLEMAKGSRVQDAVRTAARAIRDAQQVAKLALEQADAEAVQP